jgi:magnesium transporter
MNSERSKREEIEHMLFQLQKTLLNEPEPLPFEFVAVEALLANVITQLDEDTEEIIRRIEHFLKSITFEKNTVDFQTLKTLLHFSSLIKQVETKVVGIRAAINEVLDSDEDLTNMYLTKKYKNEEIRNHDDAEMLFETYFKQTDEILSRVLGVKEDIQSTEGNNGLITIDVINISLDSYRNSMISMELQMGVATFSVSSGTFITSIFGMNLISGYENSQTAFLLTVGSAVSCSTIVASLCIGWINNRLKTK